MIQDFVDALFSPLEKGETIAVVGKSQGGWTPYAYRAHTPALIERYPGPWYICSSTLKMQPDYIRRRREDCIRAHVLMLDDIGTKAVGPDLEPTAIVETSEGNFQWLYKLDPPCTDLDLFEAVQDALAEAGYSDPGAKSATRIFRLPGSINASKGRFASKVVEMNSAAYTLEDIIDGLDLQVSPRRRTQPAANGPVGPINDTVWTWVQENKQVLEPRESDGWYGVLCPWRDEHSEGEEAKYSPLGAGSMPLVRGFKCFHGHCHHRTITDYLEWVEEQTGKKYTSGTTELSPETVKALAAVSSDDDRFKALSDHIPAVSKYKLPDLRTTKEGDPSVRQPITSLNVKAVLELAGLTVKRDMQRHTTAVHFADPENPLAGLVEGDQDLAAESMSTILYDRAEMVGMDAPTKVAARIHMLSMWHKFSAICEWVDSRPWDGVSRFEDLAATVTVTEPEVFEMYLRRWLIQAMQAWHNWQGDPKAIEYVMVMVGLEQGERKTSWFESLVRPGDFARGANLNLGKSSSGDRDSTRQATARPLAELGEIETTFTRSAQGDLKNFLSRTTDIYRLAYGATEVQYPRTTCFAGTVNTLDFLVDATGSRRFWPVHVSSCNVDHDIDIQQLWAEVKTWWAAGEQYWLTEEEDAVREGDSETYHFENPTTELVEEYLSTHSASNSRAMTCTQVLLMLGIHTSNANKRSTSDALTKHLGPAQKMSGVRRCWNVPTGSKALELVKDPDADA